MANLRLKMTTTSSDTIPKDQEKTPEEVLVEKQLLIIGYFAILIERYGINQDIGECMDRDSAVLFAYEQKYMQIPPEMEWDNIQANVDEKHHPRIERVWRVLEKAEAQWITKIKAYLHHLSNVPDNKDEESKKLVHASIIHIRQEFQEALACMIVSGKNDAEAIGQVEDMDPLTIWKETEESLRKDIYANDQEYLRAFRGYCEMLLEKQEAKGRAQEQVLNLDRENPTRKMIVEWNRALRMIDAIHQAVSWGKAGHHEQEEGRLRKTGRVPYALHPAQVSEAYLADIMPFIIGETPLPIDTAFPALLGPIHDMGEDTTYEIDGTVQGLAERGNRTDSSLESVYESAFDDDRRRFRKKTLDLIKNPIQTALKSALRILSKNTELTEEETQRALRENIMPRGTIASLFGIEHAQLRQWGLRRGEKSPQPKGSRTFELFPSEKSVEDKMDKFLIRLNVIGNKKVRQHVLIVKIEDRNNNLKSMWERETDYQLRTLRSTTNRLIAWAIEDHDSDRSPLYNALPRLIDTTLEEYERIQKEHPEVFDERDAKYIAYLKEKQLSVPRLELPETLRAELKKYDDANRTVTLTRRKRRKKRPT